MNIISWSDDFVLGIAEIDDEHRRLVAIIVELAETMLSGANTQSILGQLTNLAERAREHFQTEESTMSKIDFSSRTAHAQAHSFLLVQLAILEQVVADETLADRYFILDFISSWLIDHIQTLDRDLSESFVAWSHAENLQRLLGS